MEMLVETYEATEDADQEPGMEDEAIRLAEELGLEGQMGLVKKNEEADTSTRNPYREITEEEYNVYKALLNSDCAVNRYSHGPIPIRVMQVIAHAKEFFPWIEVWYSRHDPDPVLVGRPAQFHRPIHILARWGPELLPMSKLRTMAGEKVKAKLMAGLKEAETSVKAHLAMVESLSPDQVMQLSRNEVHYHGPNP